MAKIKMIRREGGSRVVSLPKDFPNDWKAIEIVITKRSKGVMTLRFDRVR